MEEKLEDKIKKTERQLLELSLSLKRLNEEYQHFLQKMALTPEQLNGDFEHLTPSIREKLHNEKKMLDEKLNLELNNVPDHLKIQKTISERAAIQQHWLYVR